VRNEDEDSVSAIIVTCESKEHSLEDSCLNERWNLEHKNRLTVMAAVLGNNQSVCKVIREPSLRVVNVKTIRDRAYIVEESPGLRENLSSEDETTLVVSVKEQKRFWPQYFTSTRVVRIGKYSFIILPSFRPIM
jgi:hypothetical protein